MIPQLFYRKCLSDIEITECTIFSLSLCCPIELAPSDLHVRKIRSFNYTFHIGYLNTENIQRIIAFDNFIGLNCIAMH